MAQTVRFATLEKFKANELRLLVCSDVAARGLDIGGLSHVFNFDVPHHAEDYVHRIGRTGRAGLEGHAFTIASPEDRFAVEAIEKLIGHAIPPVNVEGLDPVDWAEEDGRKRRRAAAAAPRERRAERKPTRQAESEGRLNGRAPDAANAEPAGTGVAEMCAAEPASARGTQAASPRRARRRARPHASPRRAPREPRAALHAAHERARETAARERDRSTATTSARRCAASATMCPPSCCCARAGRAVAREEQETEA